MSPSIRFQSIDETNIGDHTHLRPADRCIFLREYTSGKDYRFSETNNLISNFKKKRGAGGFRYKAEAIRQFAGEIAGGLNADWLRTATLVPVPPSKIKGDPDYDGRVTTMCSGLRVPFPVDVREIIHQTASIRSAHESPDRPTVQELLAIYEIDESKCAPTPSALGIVDDVLTAGTHYRAVHTRLSERFPGVSIVGIFVARRVFANDRFEEFFSDDD